MAGKLEWLVGTWECNDGFSPVALYIRKTKRGLSVRAFDRSDGEWLKISDVKWNGEALSFETFVPSTKWGTRNVLRPISRTKFMHEITYWEPWKKMQRKVRKGDW